MGARLHRLETDPTAAPIVERIFAQYLSGRGLFAIAEGLTRDGIPSPSAHDPARNRHRDGRAWSKSAVRAILTNPRYTGRQVWNRQRRDEKLLDVEDVAAGNQTKLVWNKESAWVWSTKPTHDALVSSEDFARVQAQMSAGAHRPIARKGHRTNRTYVLAGLVHCVLCDRRMQGHWNHGTAHYRCRYAAEYALANKVNHPKTVYLREDAVVPRLDAWLAELFDPANLDATCEALAMAGWIDEMAEARMEAARRKIGDCDSRLAKYRAALDAGADAAVVAGWMTEVQGERLGAETDLGEAVPGEQMTKEQVRMLVMALRDIASVLATADPKLKAEVYAELGVSVAYDHERRLVSVEARPGNACANGRVGEAFGPASTPPLLRGEVRLRAA